MPARWCVVDAGLNFLGVLAGLEVADAVQSLSGDVAVETPKLCLCVGYLLAAPGPIIAGSLHSYFNSWTPVIWLCAVVSLLCAVFGYLGGRNIMIHKDA